MNSDRITKLFNILSSNNRFFTAQELSNNLGVSTRTIKADIKKLKMNIENFGAKIISKQGSGYKINVFDKNIFESKKFFSNISSFYTFKFSKDILSDHTIDVLQFIISNDNKIINKEDIYNRFYFSESTINNDIVIASEFLSEFGIKKINYYKKGFRFQGDEINIRFCFLNLSGLLYHKMDYKSKIKEFNQFFYSDINFLKTIRNIIITILEKFDFIISDNNLQFLTRYIILSLNRIKVNKNIIFNKSRHLNSIQYTKTNKIVNLLIQEIPEIKLMNKAEIDVIRSLLIIFKEPLQKINLISSHTPIMEDLLNISNSAINEINKFFSLKESFLKYINMYYYNILTKILLKRLFSLDLLNLNFMINEFNIDKLDDILPITKIITNIIIKNFKNYGNIIINKKEENQLLRYIYILIKDAFHNIKNLNIGIISNNFSKSEILKDRLNDYFNFNNALNFQIFPLYSRTVKYNKNYDFFIVDSNISIFYEYDTPKIFIDFSSSSEIINKLVPYLINNMTNNYKTLQSFLKKTTINFEKKSVFNINEYMKITDNLYIISENSKHNKIEINK